MFQATKAVKEDTLKLVHTINVAVSDNPVLEHDLDELFDAMWPKLEIRLATLPRPEETLPAKRTTEDMVAEILEIVRTDANRKKWADVLTGIGTPMAGVSQSNPTELASACPKRVRRSSQGPIQIGQTSQHYGQRSRPRTQLATPPRFPHCPNPCFLS